MGAPRGKTYKRSVKNLLLDKSYQLRFTLFMVILAAALMSLLGWWVLRVADQATTVALNDIDGAPCPQVPELSAPAAAGGEPDESTAPAVTEDPVEGELVDEVEAVEAGEETEERDEAGSIDEVEEAEPAEAGAAREPEGADAEEEARERARPVVTIDDSQLEAVPLPSAGPSEEEIANLRALRSACLARQAENKASIEDRKTLITQVLIGCGLLLIVGLFVYGIKMTHRVAGPLHKVSLYMAKLRDGKYDTVYDLRKGDQLVEFYEHFKAAHAGLRKLQEEDRDRIRDVLAAADEADLASKSPELKAAIDELRGILAEQEDSLG